MSSPLHVMVYTLLWAVLLEDRRGIGLPEREPPFVNVFHRRGKTVFFCLFVCISLTADGPQRARLPIPPTATLLSCLWSLKIFPSLPASRLFQLFQLFQLINRWYRWLKCIVTLPMFSRFPLREPEQNNPSCRGTNSWLRTIQ